jgi:hypothetical protein
MPASGIAGTVCNIAGTVCDATLTVADAGAVAALAGTAPRKRKLPRQLVTSKATYTLFHPICVILLMKAAVTLMDAGVTLPRFSSILVAST